MRVEVPAPPERVFALVTDWPRHHEWMFMTTAEQVAADRVEAYTGIWPLGFLDTMTITRWEPPILLQVEHTGALLRGRGVVRIEPHQGGSRVIWAERVELRWWAVPFWPVAHALSVALARRSLRKLVGLLS